MSKNRLKPTPNPAYRQRRRACERVAFGVPIVNITDIPVGAVRGDLSDLPSEVLRQILATVAMHSEPMDASAKVH